MKTLQEILGAWIPDTKWINAAADKALHKSLVTFDVFDTALTRDCDSPIDIFARAEQALCAQDRQFKGFAAAREQAEEKAREKAWRERQCPEVTFAEIYAELPRILPLSPQSLAAAKARELREEEKALAAAPDILALVKKLESLGRAYGFVSDMYLPTEFISEILRREGFQNPQFCLVSAACGKTKAAETIWQRRELKNKRILHIGDNKRDDVEKPRKYGIETLYYGRARSCRRTGCPLAPEILPFSKSRRLSALAGRTECSAACLPQAQIQPPAERQPLIAAQDDMRVLRALGQSFGALILGAFILWLQKNARKNGVSHLLFCARNGWLMRQAWHIIAAEETPAITDSYLYVSRNILQFAGAYLTSSENRIADSAHDFLTWRLDNTTAGDMARRVAMLSPALADEAGQLLGRKNALMRRGRRAERYDAFLRGKSAALYRAFEQYHQEAMGYFRQEGLFSHRRLGIVDMGWAGTIQRSLRLLARAASPDFSCCGFFYGLSPLSASNMYLAGPMQSAFFQAFDPPEEMEKNWQGAGLLEELHNPPEGAARRLIMKDGKWQPQTEQSAGRQHEYDTLIAPFQQGALQALREIKNGGESESGLTRADLTAQNAMAAFRLVFLSPSAEEIAALAKISHGILPDHCDETPMYETPLPRRRKDYRRALYNFDWRMALMKIWLSKAAPRQKRCLKRLIRSNFTAFSPRELRFLTQPQQGAL